jgi:hypothetical protein
MSAIQQQFPTQQALPSLSGGQPTTAIRLVQAFGLLVAALLVVLALTVGA